MNITRNIINDLLPIYFSGEGSEDTRNLVDEYFRQDPAFEREARKSTETLQALAEMGTIQADSSIEKAALNA